MELKELNDAIKELERHHCYPLSDSEQPNGYILEYNAEDRVWEYYYFDEKDGKRDLKTFVTEDEACKYVLKRAIIDAPRDVGRFVDVWAPDFARICKQHTHIVAVCAYVYVF